MITKKIVSLIVMLVCNAIWLTPAFSVSTTKTQPVRALHFVLWGSSVADAKRITDVAKKSGFNTLVIALGDAVKLHSFPGELRKDAWSADELLNFVNYARQLGLNVIPEVRLLSHQETFIGKARPDLMFNASTYDPRKAEVYAIVTAYIDEVIALLHPSAIAIGHDELAGWLLKRDSLPDTRFGLQPGEISLPAELFLQDTLRIHDYLRAHGIETWMWGDMLISPEEFPQMLARNLHGGSVGYGKALRNQLPRDIVICDWHYDDNQPDFPSLAAMRKEGFRVLGSTWKKPETLRAFSRYAAQHAGNGMIATTWFHVPNKEWDVVERIIRESGEEYSKDFPDAK